MIKRKRFTIPEYREKKEIYTLLGYEEKEYKEKGTKCFVTFSLDESSENYHELRKLEKQIFPKGPPFIPIVVLVVIAFALLSTFVILLAQSVRDATPFDLTRNFITYLVPAFISIFLDVVYTVLYFKINQSIIERGGYTIEFIKEEVKKIKEK